MNMKMINLLCDMEVTKEKLNDIATAHNWFVEDTFINDELQTSKEVEEYGLAYNEHRIHNNQILDLMLMYLHKLDKNFEQINELIDKEKDRTHDEIGNGQHNVEQ
ncbi:DUF1474 family protein [Staphylococcus cohnii]|uniref:type II toxin-antitoxin system toxin TscT n=1 Tax=Staphylococcus cohnii TaxID=29382 RepID=UPI00384ABA11